MDLLKKITSSSPVPAGGAAVAYSAALAIGLIYKVVVFETNRNLDHPEIEGNLLTVKKEIEKLLRDVEKLVGEDPESYLRFAQSLRADDKPDIKLHFSNILDVSMKVMEKSDTAFDWIHQLYPIVPGQMITHLRVACELLMGAINGTAHVLRDNLQSIKAPKKRGNYLRRLNELHESCQKRYGDVRKKIG